MKITENRTNLFYFKEVKIGQVFKFEDQFYLRIPNDYYGENAVNLSTGYLDGFEDSAEVELLDAELVIH